MKTKTTKKFLKMLSHSIHYNAEMQNVYASFERMPALRQLLTDHEYQMEEEHADVSVPSLVNRYMNLKKENKLESLFHSQYLIETGGLEGSEWL